MEIEKGGPVDGAADWLDAPGEVWRFNAGTGARESGGVVEGERVGLASELGREPTDGRHVVVSTIQTCKRRGWMGRKTHSPCRRVSAASQHRLPQLLAGDARHIYCPWAIETINAK